MDFIKKLRLVRDVGREARRRGYGGNVLTQEDRVPLVGTLREQMVIATIGCDCSPGPMSTREREFLNRSARAAVLTCPNGSCAKLAQQRLGKPIGRRSW
jgi:hypothetical protein